MTGEQNLQLQATTGGRKSPHLMYQFNHGESYTRIVAAIHLLEDHMDIADETISAKQDFYGPQESN